MEFGPDQRLCFVAGLSHMGMEGSGLFAYDDRVDRIAEVIGIRTNSSKQTVADQRWLP